MNNAIINFDYKGSQISFNKGKNVMINATEMAKPFGKRCNDFLSAKQTKELISSLSAKTGISATGLVVVNQGGNNQGTWMHEDLALVFAQWLAPDFYLWCNDRIKELLTTGVTTVSNDDETIARAMSILQHRLEIANEEKRALEEKNAQQQAIIEQKDETIGMQASQLKEQAPKVQYVDTTLLSPRTYTSTQCAKELGLRTAKEFHRTLKEWGVMFYQSGQWMLTAKYCGLGYTKTKTQSGINDYGKEWSNTITVWTETGRMFLHKLFENKKIA